jgi:HD domain
MGTSSREVSSGEELLSRRELLGHGAWMAGGLVGLGSLAGFIPRADATAVRSSAADTPHTRLAHAAEKLLESTSPQFLIDHCHRSVELAQLIVETENIDLDDEVLYVGVLLHDLGLTTRFHSSQVRFEVASANAARDLALAYGMTPARAANIWDVAALHGTGGISDFKSRETAVGSDAIGRDVIGYGLDEFDPDVVADIMDTRVGFAEPFIQAIVTDLQDKYQVASSTWMTTIAAKYIPGFHQGDIQALALADPWENPQP